MPHTDDDCASALADALFDDPTVGHCLVSPDGTIARANERWLSLTGYAAGEVVGREFLGLFPGARDELAAHLARARAGSRVPVPPRMEGVGTRTWHWEGTIAPVQMRGGSGALVTALDVPARGAGHGDATDSRRAEHNDAKLRAVFGALVEGVVFLNARGEVEEANDAVHRRHGHTLRELREPELDPRRRAIRPDGTPFPEEQQPAIVALRTGEAVRDVEMGFVASDGSVRWRLVNAQPAYDDRGTLLGAVASFFDVTERKLAADALRERDERFRALIENLSSAVSLIDAAGRFSVVNPRFLEMFGLPPGCDVQNVNDQRWSEWQVFDEEGRLLPFDEHPVRKAVLTLKPVREVVVGVRLPSGGHLVWMSVNAEPVLEENSSIKYVICTYHDVTQLRRAEEALRTREREARERAAELEAILGCVADALMVYDRDGRIVRSNAAADSLLVHGKRERNATLDERVSRAPYRAFDGDGRPLALADLPVARALRDGETVSGYMLRLRADDQERVLRVNAAPLVVRGERVGAVAFFDDVTERERGAEALRQSEAALDAFVAASPGILNLKDEQLRYVKTDAITPTYFGLTRETLVGKALADLAPPLVDEFGPTMRRIIDTGQPLLNTEIHTPVPSRPDEIQSWRISYFPVPLPGGRRGIGTMGVEITDLKKAEAALRASESQLRELAARVESVREEEKSRISRDLHDELGQLLTALRLDLEAIEDGLSSMATEGPLAALLDRAVDASELVARSIEAMHRVARYLRPASLDNFGLAEALRQECQWFEERTPIQFEFSSADAVCSLGPDVETALFRIAQEAFTNVVRHSRAARARIDLEVAASTVTLRIEDDGVGFDVTRLTRTSLGIVGMRERAQRLGGDLSVTGGPAVGTVLVARIPLTGTTDGQSKGEGRA